MIRQVSIGRSLKAKQLQFVDLFSIMKNIKSIRKKGKHCKITKGNGKILESALTLQLAERNKGKKREKEGEGEKGISLDIKDVNKFVSKREIKKMFELVLTLDQ